MLSLTASSLAFATTPSCPECPDCPVQGPVHAALEPECFDSSKYDATVDDDMWTDIAGIPKGYGMFRPGATENSAYEVAQAKCSLAKEVTESDDCMVDGVFNASLTFDPYHVDRNFCFVEAGSHIAHAEGFNGAKVEAILTASECSYTDPTFDWQHDARHPDAEFCYIGSMDGLNAMAILGDGTKQTLNTGKTYLRTYLNTELRGESSDYYPRMAVSKNVNTGGFDQPSPDAADILPLIGATEQFADVDRDTLEVVNGGHAVKKIFTAHGLPYQTEIPTTATSSDVFAIVTEYSHLHVNVRPDEDTRFEPNCDSTSDDFSDGGYCGLYGHCGSKICPKHEFSYETSPGVPAVPDGHSVGVGFEDNVLFVAQEGSAGSFGPEGTVQVLDVDSGDWYQLPQLSMGVVEMAFSIATGHPDYIAVGIEDYGKSTKEDMGLPDEPCGSGWNVWIGKKDPSSSHFLDRNGLGVNQGRIYRFVADSGETDMATLVDWPASGKPGYAWTDKMGKLEPIDHMFNGIYKETDTQKGWNATSINCAMTVQGNTPVRMTGVRKQEWGAVNPDQPNQWAIAETGLGKSDTLDGISENMPLGDRSSTLIFLEAHFIDAFANYMDGSVTNRAGEPLPSMVTSKVFHVMKDYVVMGPDRGPGLSYVDSLFWGKGGNVFFAEDSSAPGGYNIAGVYNPATEKTVALAGAIGNDNRKMNTVANFPYGSFDGASDQELTGWFDASAALTLPADATPQEYYDALDAKHMILNNQMKGNYGCMNSGFYYSSQMMYISVPEFDWETTTLSAPAACDASRRRLRQAYGRKRSLKTVAIDQRKCDFASGGWEKGQQGSHDADGCQRH